MSDKTTKIEYVVKAYTDWRDGPQIQRIRFLTLEEAQKEAEAQWRKNDYFVEEANGFKPKVYRVDIIKVITKIEFEQLEMQLG